MKPIAENIERILRKIFTKKNPILAEIMLNWSKIVGLEFSSHTNPFKIVNSKERGNKITILHVQVANTSLATTISFQQEVIIERITVYLGFKAINKIKLIVV